MAKSDGTVYVDTHIDTKGFGKGVNTMQKQISGLSSAFGKLGAVITSTFAAGILVNWGKEAIQAGADTQAMAAQFKQVFGKVEQEATSSLNSIAESTGIVTERLRGSYTQIAAFAKTAGMTEKEAMELADRAMIAVADSAAFYDRSLEDTTESLRSFLKGNFENDAALGLSATEYTRNAAAVELFGKNFKELNEQQKQLTLLKMVEDANKLSGAMGQATRESDTWNNVTGNLSQALKNLSASVGQYILPIATKIVKYISSVIESINALLNKVFQLNNAITGQETYSNAAEGANEYASEISGIADATKEATKAQNNYLAGLDEIRTYQTPQEVSEIGNVSYSDFSAENRKENNNLDNSISLIDRFKNKLNELKQQYPILNNIFSIIQTQMSLSKEIGTDLFNLLTRPLTENKDGFLISAANIATYLKGIFETIIKVVDEAMRHLRSVYESDIKPVIEDLSNDISELVSKFLQWFNNDMQPVLDRWGEKFNSLWEKHIGPFLEKMNIFIGDVAKEIGYLWNEHIEPFINWFVSDALPFLTPAIEKIGDIFLNTVGVIADITGFLLDILNGLIKYIVGTFTGDWRHALEGIKEILVGIVNVMITLIEDFINNKIIGMINSMLDSINMLSEWTGVNISIPKIPEINIPEIKIPMLATGAVIPPNAPFMAMLGDQKHGTNIEAPLATIEQALDNVLSRRGGTSGSMTLHNVMQVNRRVLYDEFIEEAKLRMSTTGRNPFDLA